MSKIIKFNRNEEEHSCPVCDIVNEHMEYVKDCESEEELFEVLSDLVSESIKMGVISFLQQDITKKAAVLDSLIYGDCCDEEECDC